MKELVQIIKEDCVAKILDDVFLSLKGSGGEVFVSGINERKFLEMAKEAIVRHIKRLAKTGITEKLLAKEGDLFFFSGSQSIYRWVPEHLFSPIPIYVYGNKVAMILWGPSHQAVIIEDMALADAYRKQFLLVWEKALIPPRGDVIEDEKKRLEGAITKRFGGQVSPITNKDKRIFRDILGREKSQTYGNSFFYLCQAANGIGTEKLGLKFFDGDLLAAIGIFNRFSMGGGWHFHIIHPIGKFEIKKILSLAKGMLELSGHPVFVKKVSKIQRERLLDVGFSPIEGYPWHAEAMEEDDTFSEQILNINETLKEVEGAGKGELRDKYRRFRARFGRQIQTKDLIEENRADAVEVVKRFFSNLEAKEIHISQPSDYDNIIFHPPLGTNGQSYFTKLLYLGKQPIGFFAAEPIGRNSAGLFANITLHQEIPYLSEYLIVSVCQLLKTRGFKYLNLGGSETAGLFQFKEKFSPVAYNKMHWLVYKF